MPPHFIRCRSLVKCRSLNILRWNSTVRSLAHTTWSHLSSDSSSGTNVGNFKVINETLNKRKREQRSAGLLFGRQLKQSGFNHDVETYMAIVRLLLCHSGMDVRLHNLFMHVIENNIVGIEISHLLEALIEEKLIKAVEVLVKVYASIRRFEDAINTVSEMKSKSGLMVSTRTCNFIINELIEWREKVSTVDSVYKELKRNGLFPNIYTYGILMKGYCRNHNLIEAGNLFSQMELDGVKPNAFITGTFIHSISNPDSAFRIIHAFRELKKPLDAYAYASVIRGLVKESRLQDAEDVFFDMRVRKVVPDANCYGALIRGYLKKGDTGRASDLHNEMESTTGMTLNANYVAARSMMKRLCGLGRLDEALSEFTGFMESGGFVDGVSFNMAIDASCKLGRMGDAMWLVKVMKGRKMKIGKMHYRTLMNGYCEQGEPWKALDVFQEMMRNGLTPDSTDYHVLARGGVFLPLNMLFKH